MRISDLDILILPGLGGSGPDHWQGRWAQKLSTGRLVEQKDWHQPKRDEWIAMILREIDAAQRPVALIGHSLGAVAAASALAEGGKATRDKVAMAFLVAPPDLEADEMARLSLDPAFKEKAPRFALDVPGVIVASRTDPYATWSHAEDLAALWGLELSDAGDAGHINADSGHGPWPEGLMRLAGLLMKI